MSYKHLHILHFCSKPSNKIIQHNSMKPHKTVLRWSIRLAFMRCLVQSSAKALVILAEIFCGFPWFLWPNAWILPSLDNDHILSSSSGLPTYLIYKSLLQSVATQRVSQGQYYLTCKFQLLKWSSGKYIVITLTNYSTVFQYDNTVVLDTWQIMLHRNNTSIKIQ
jgi:hypothetical protein